MLSANIVLFTALAYVAVLFLVAFVSDMKSRKGWLGLVHSPIVYTLSISVYCTSWTFYGAVGSAARNGLEFATIYLGPTLVFVGWWFLLRKLVRIGRIHRTSSIGDLISSRYGKSTSLAVLVTLIAVIGTTPYIALQLKAVTASFQVVAEATDTSLLGIPTRDIDIRTGFWVAVAMAAFTILFGIRNIDANEHHHGVVAAIALEALKDEAWDDVIHGEGIRNAAKLRNADPRLRRTLDALGQRAFLFDRQTRAAAPRWLCLAARLQLLAHVRREVHQLLLQVLLKKAGAPNEDLHSSDADIGVILQAWEEARVLEQRFSGTPGHLGIRIALDLGHDESAGETPMSPSPTHPQSTPTPTGRALVANA